MMRTRILDAPHLPIAAYLAYVGATSLIGETTPAIGALPAWLGVAWSASLIVGACLIGWGVATESTRAESTGHMFHLFGIGLYTVVHLSLLGDVVVVVSVLAGVSLLRMRVLARSRAARREAGRILRGRP